MNIVKENILSKIGQTDYVKNGELHTGGTAPSIMVSAETDLDNLPDIYPPGTVAYTAGFQDMWQLDTDGNWVSMT